MRRRRRRGPRIEFRIYIVGFCILAILGGIVLKLWWLEVARGAEYAKKIAQRSVVTVRIPSVRGEIRDRNGIPLVQNRASYEVDFYLPEMVRGYRQLHEGEAPLIQYQGTAHGMATKKTEADIVQIVNTAVIPRLEELDLAKDYNAKRLKIHYRNDTEIPFTYLEDIDFPTLAKFSEHDVGLPGVNIGIKPVREYLYGALAAHLLGYVGMPVDIDQDDAAHYNFYQPDVEGKSQIEAAYDKYLRGTPGVRVMQRNIHGAIDGELKTIQPKPGDNVYLTIDARIQMIAEQALRQPLLGRAAAVVINPNNGDILAMASIPSFDPNIFIPSISGSDWAALQKNPAVPLVDRAVSGFPPGSTFKIVTALAGLTKTPSMANAHFDCTGSVNYGGRPFHCWIAAKGGSHGVLDLEDALKVSCDCYFYQYGNTAGIDAMDRVGAMLGIGQLYNIGLSDEKAGVMPGPEWMKEHYPKEKWTDAYTANASIGQGYVLASPLQMAMAYAAVANGGVCYSPRLVRTVLNPDGTPALGDDGKVAVPDQPIIRADLRSVVSQKDIEEVRKGLWDVVNAPGGTGSRGKVPGTVVAGKTGTAQAPGEHGKGGENIDWFSCFAPYDHPQYVIVTMVQSGEHGGHGGTVAAPVAQYILSRILAMNQGTYNVRLASLKAANNPHPFNDVVAIDYTDKAPTVTASDADDDAGPNDKHSEAEPEMGAGSAKPDIRAAADAGGNVKAAVRRAAEQRKAAPAQADRRSLLERIFHPHQNNPQTPQTTKRAHWPF
ncbi:MAG TPA: penicillin-binding protein 2 [Chthoniobacteraceae bacterium]|jgi:penicillin-binding protein 2|nr:penicillin-binding protein 2 [Chthoniobacteraceae bacterium]